MLHQPITAAPAHDAARRCANALHIANLISNRAQDYSRAVLAHGGRTNTATDYALIELLDAVQWVCDGDIGEEIQNLLHAHGLDEEGFHTIDGDRDNSRDREVTIGARL